MNSNIYRFVILFFYVNYVHIADAMTRPQLVRATKVMRTACQPKFKVTNEMVDNIKNGEFIEDREVMCYISCILTMAQTVKNGKINIDSAIKQIDMNLPPDMKDPAKKALAECKPVINEYKNKDICEASFYATKCMYNANPEIFLFP